MFKLNTNLLDNPDESVLESEDVMELGDDLVVGLEEVFEKENGNDD